MKHGSEKRAIRLAGAVCILAAVRSAGAEKPTLTVERLQIRVAPAQIQSVGGFAGERIRVNRSGYLNTFPIDTYVRMVEEKKHRAWWWIGEQPGKWLESAVLASEQARDQSLRDAARAVLGRLAAAQEPSGYLGITSPEIRTEALPLRGMDAYELYFMLHGLLTAYDFWQDAKALTAAARLGDYFVATIGPGTAEFWPRPKEQTIAGHDVHYGWEGTLLADPMLRLYERTGDARYLTWSRWVIGSIDRWSGHDAFSKLDQVAAGTLGVHQLQPYVHAHTFHMNFLAFLRLYQITGDKALLRKVTGAWNDIASRQMYITGGVSVGEHYEPGHNLPVTGHVVETCASMSWIELTQYLLELTGDPRYADAIERLMWNHVFAAQSADGDGNRYHTPLNGVKPAGYYHGPDCCTASGHRILAELPTLFYATDAEGIYVNQFVDSVCSFRMPSGAGATIAQNTKFPADETIVMTLTTDRPERFALRVRLPSWCDAPTLTVNSVLVDARRPGSYLTIRRIWRTGDRIVLRLPAHAEWTRGSHTTEGMWALTQGPVVFALDTVWWSDAARHELEGVPEDLSRVVGVAIDPEHPQATVNPSTTPAGALGPAYEVTVLAPGGKPFSVPLLPFANVGRWYRDPASKPGPNGTSFSYAVWLLSATSEAFLQAERSAAALKNIGWSVAKGDWTVGDGVLAQRSLGDDCHALAGDSRWTDYTLEVKAHKTGGAEGFLVLFRARDGSNFYWWNLGGWQNREHGIEREINGERSVLVRRPGTIETGRWYTITVRVAGASVRCSLDGALIHELTDATFSAGRIGLGSWLTRVEYKDLKVTSTGGEVLYAPSF